MVPNGAIGARFSPDGGTLYLTDATGPGIYDVRDVSRLPDEPAPSAEHLAWVAGEGGTFAFDVTDPVRPRVVLGGPGEPQPGHWLLLSALRAPARGRAWPDRGAPIGFYISTGSLWGAYVAPSHCPPLGSRGRSAERLTLSPIGESGRPASWGRGPAPSPPALA